MMPAGVATILHLIDIGSIYTKTEGRIVRSSTKRALSAQFLNECQMSHSIAIPSQCSQTTHLNQNKNYPGGIRVNRILPPYMLMTVKRIMFN